MTHARHGSWNTRPLCSAQAPGHLSIGSSFAFRPSKKSRESHETPWNTNQGPQTLPKTWCYLFCMWKPLLFHGFDDHCRMKCSFLGRVEGDLRDANASHTRTRHAQRSWGLVRAAAGGIKQPGLNTSRCSRAATPGQVLVKTRNCSR